MTEALGAERRAGCGAAWLSQPLLRSRPRLRARAGAARAAFAIGELDGEHAAAAVPVDADRQQHGVAANDAGLTNPLIGASRIRYGQASSSRRRANSAKPRSSFTLIALTAPAGHNSSKRARCSCSRSATLQQSHPTSHLAPTASATGLTRVRLKLLTSVAPEAWGAVGSKPDATFRRVGREFLDHVPTHLSL